jgi:hypothetical protein
MNTNAIRTFAAHLDGSGFARTFSTIAGAVAEQARLAAEGIASEVWEFNRATWSWTLPA